MALTFVEIDADSIGLADQKIALEHQGEQHHRAVNIFAGDETKGTLKCHAGRKALGRC